MRNNKDEITTILFRTDFVLVDPDFIDFVN